MTYSMNENRPLLGAHFSVSGGLENALYTARKLNCPVVQMFTKNARTWKETSPDPAAVDRFKSIRIETKVKIVLSHASYLINIASPEPGKRKQAIHALACEMDRSALLGIDGVVLHPGAYTSSTEAEGIRLAVSSLKTVLENTDPAGPRLLIETTSGQGTCLGDRFDQIADILEKLRLPQRTGVCMDSCHMFAAGMDIASDTGYHQVMDTFQSAIGFERLFAFHLNDSKHELGSKKDRHAHIGKGEIGIEAFSRIMNDDRFRNIPKILETPKESGNTAMDPVNLDRLLSLII